MSKYDQEVNRILNKSQSGITESELNYLRRVGALVSAPLRFGIAVAKAAVDFGVMSVKPDGSGRFDDNGIRKS
jgi:hypothetical protein